MNWMDRLNERAALMGQMLDTIGAMDGMTKGVRSGLEIRSAAQRCRSCQNTEECAHWLAENKDGAAHPPSICPNADFFETWIKV